MASSVSVTVPIWLTFTSSALPIAFLDAFLQDRRIGHEHVVADQLHLVAERLGQQLPAVPVLLGAAVFDRDDRVLPAPVDVEIDHALRIARGLAGLLELVAPAARLGGPEFAGGHVERDEHVVAGLGAGLADGFEHHVQRFAIGFQARREPPSSPTPVDRPRPFRIDRSAWKISAPARSPSLNDGKPSGITMNSWKSTFESACAPPLRMFIIGTGSSVAGRVLPGRASRDVRVERLAGARRVGRSAAIDTPSSALAPSRLLVGVPSSAIIASSS